MDEVEKIVKALRYCDSEEWTDCEKCVRFGECCEEHRSVDADAADLIGRLSAELEKTKQERDAAVNDMYNLGICCYSCKHKTEGNSCQECNLQYSGWEWRGVCKENCGGTV